MTSGYMRSMYLGERRQEVGTPRVVYDALDREFGFSSFDPCPNPRPKDFNGLRADWKELSGGKPIYINPPYDCVDAWLKKIIKERDRGCVVVALLPARTYPAWFHWGVLEQSKDIRFLKGRLKFEGYALASPFGSMVVVFT